MMPRNRANQSRQPTPGAPLGCISASLARRGCAGRSGRHELRTQNDLLFFFCFAPKAFGANRRKESGWVGLRTGEQLGAGVQSNA